MRPWDRRALRGLWADRPLRSKGLAIIALPVSILLVALFWVGLATREEEAAEDHVQLTLQIQGDLQKIDALIYRAALEANTTGAASAAMPRRREAEQELPQILDDLSTAIIDPEQRQRLQRTQPLALGVVQQLRAGAADARATAEALQTLQVELDAMRTRESVLLAARTQRADAARARNLVITRSAGGIGLLGSIAAILLFSTGIVRRVAFLENNAHRLARGEPLAALPGGTDEIGRLASALDQASALLSQRQHRLEDLVARLFKVQEDERRRVAYELHDGLAQVAAAAHQHLQAYAARHSPSDETAQAALEHGLSLVQRTVRETRNTIAGLRPTGLDDFGLSAALKNEVEALRDVQRAVQFESTLGPERLPALIETALFRIAQEALNNIRKHAGRAASVQVSLRRTGRTVQLLVTDDGVGFDARHTSLDPARPGERIGLEAMRERAALVGGTVHIDSAPGRGTRLQVDVLSD